MLRRVDISHKTIFFITAFLALLWALFQIRDVIILLFIAIIFMSALSPMVEYLEKLKLPKSLAIAVVYVLILALLVGLISLVTIPLFEQTSNLFLTLPDRIQQLIPQDGPINRNLLQEQLNSFSKNAIDFTFAIFNNFLAFISIAVLTFYLLLEHDRLDSLIGQFFVGREEVAKLVVRKIEDKLGAWMRGQIVLSLIISVLVYLALFLLGVPYALPLAIIAGIFEVVPVIGPIISAIPAVIVGWTIAPLLALFVAIAFFVIQQLENHLIVPQVMKRAVGLNPLIVILAVSIGGKLLGLAGALLAVPITVVIQIIIEDVLRDKVV